MKYVAFLRGINVGGHTMIKMQKLRHVLELLGLSNVKTVLASGNVLFETPIKEPVILAKKLEEKLKKTFGFEIVVILRTGAHIQSLVKSSPFKMVTVTPNTRFHVTFTSTQDISNAVEISSLGGTTELMKQLEKEYGKKITTRNWNTILKIEKNL